MSTKKLTELALLTAIALTIFLIELQIPNPFPIPGVKLGLANIVTIYAIYHYRAGEVFLLILTRIVLGALFSGNLVALLYSLVGGLLCLIGIIPLRHVIPADVLWSVSVLGAVFHNIGQISMAILLTRTPEIAAYFPVLLISGCCAGMFTGLCAQLLIKRIPQIHCMNASKILTNK